MSTRSSFAALLIAKTGLSFSSLNYFESLQPIKEAPLISKLFVLNSNIDL